MQSDNLAQFTNISKMILARSHLSKKDVTNKLNLKTKNLKKAIMNRSRLLYCRKKKPEANWHAYKRQRNFCVRLLRKPKKEFYNNLNVKYIIQNKLFCKTVKPSFTGKTLTDKIISYVENTKVVSVGSELVEIFSKYFRNSAQNLGIDGLTNISSDNDTATTGKGMEEYQYHPNIKVIQENIDSTNNFPLDLINPECISKIIHQKLLSKVIFQQKL